MSEPKEIEALRAVREALHKAHDDARALGFRIGDALSDVDIAIWHWETGRRPCGGKSEKCACENSASADRPSTLAEAERAMASFMERALGEMGVVTRQSPYGLADCPRCNGYGKTLETEVTEVDSELVWRDCPECSR